MRRALMSLAILAGVAALGPARGEPANGFTTPGIDRSMFREGEVRRTEADSGAWRALCDEIVKISSRFCNLATLGRDARGVAWLGMVLSSGDDGKPAAMLTLPFGIDLRGGVTITARAPAGKKAKPVSTRLAIVSCDGLSCMTLWPVAPEQMRALAVGEGLIVSFAVAEERAFRFDTNLETKTRRVEIFIDPRGFKEALNTAANGATPGNRIQNPSAERAEDPIPEPTAPQQRTSTTTMARRDLFVGCFGVSTTGLRLVSGLRRNESDAPVDEAQTLAFEPNARLR